MKREVKIGIFAVAMIVAAWAGIRFLKGFDIFGRNTVYYAAYDQIGGVQSASPVMMRGVKIGTVTGIAFDPQLSDKVVLQLTIKRQYRIPEDSEAKIVSSSLMGSKAIEITYGDSDVCLAKGDTLRSGRNRDLMDVAGSELEFFKQRVSRLTDDLSRTLDNVNRLLEANEENITGTLDAEKGRLQSAVGSLAAFADMLGENAPRVDSIVGNLNDVTAQLSEAEFARKLSDAVERFDGLLAKIDDGEGTLGRLMNDPALYDSLTAAGGNLASLLADLQRYPGRYVHFSLFGRDPEKMKAKADRKAARAAEKAERDSLRQLK